MTLARATSIEEVKEVLKGVYIENFFGRALL